MSALDSTVRIAAIGLATPPGPVEQSEALRLLEARYGPELTPSSRSAMRKIFAHPSVQRRRFAIEQPRDLFGENPDARVGRYTAWAVRLADEAARGAMREAGVTPAEVSALVVNTCTGYICPGLSTYLLESLGLPRSVRAYDLAGGGCGGALANLQAAEALQRSAPEGVTLSVAVEICSATFQMGNDLSLILSNALFSDGASAAVLWNRPRGLELTASGSLFAPEYREHIRYVHREGQLHNQLSLQLPGIVRSSAAKLTADLLSPRGLTARDVPHWALHPGGEKILAALGEELGLTAAQLAPARAVLAEYGNISSPTVLFVLRRIMEESASPGAWTVLLAFGAGFSAHAWLVKMG